MKNLSHFPKTDIRFWQSAVFRQPYIVDAQRRLTKEWYARVQFQEKRAFLQLLRSQRPGRAPHSPSPEERQTLHSCDQSVIFRLENASRSKCQTLRRLQPLPILFHTASVLEIRGLAYTDLNRVPRETG